MGQIYGHRAYKFGYNRTVINNEGAAAGRFKAHRWWWMTFNQEHDEEGEAQKHAPCGDQGYVIINSLLFASLVNVVTVTMCKTHRM